MKKTNKAYCQIKTLQEEKNKYENLKRKKQVRKPTARRQTNRLRQQMYQPPVAQPNNAAIFPSQVDSPHISSS